MSSIPPVISDWRQGALEPVEASERNLTLDVLRGFALFGILIVNMALFSWPATYASLATEGLWTTRPDKVADWVVRFVAEGKFYPLFSLLFGWGMTVQMERAKSRETSFVRFASRRLVVLLGIGLVHAFLIWEGDILMDYAVFGFLLLAFRNLRPRTLLIWAAAFLMIPVAIYVALWMLLGIGSLVPEVAKEIAKELAAESESYAQLTEENLRVFSEGTWPEIFKMRARNVVFLWQYVWFFAPTLFAMFLVGVYAGQRRILQRAEENLGFIRRVLVWGLVLGVIANAVYTIGYELGSPLNVDLLWVASIAALAVGGPALCLCYVAAIVLMMRREHWRRKLRPLAATGRMALSNYLFQSLVCTTIFYNYGLGLYGSVGRMAGIGIAVLIYAAQVPLSVWWLRRFRFGPVEWLWRTLAYRKRQPMRL